MEKSITGSINSKLPHEILCRIFGLSCPIYHLLKMNRYLHLMKVCRLWREIIQNDPTFWNLTDFGSPYEDLLLETLRRSKAIQLTAIVPFNNYFSVESRKGLIWQSFITHDHWRIRNLHLKLSGSLRLDKNMFQFLGKYEYPSLRVFTIDPSPTFPDFPLLESFSIPENIRCLNIPIPLLDYLLTKHTYPSFPRLQTLSIALNYYYRSPLHFQTQVFAFLKNCPSLQSLELAFSLVDPTENVGLMSWSVFPGLSFPKLTKVWVDDFRWSGILSRFDLPNLEFYDITINGENYLLDFSNQFDYSRLRSLCIDERSFNPLKIIGLETDSIFPLKHHLHQPLYPLHLKGELVDPYPGREVRLKLLDFQHASFYLAQCLSLMPNIQCLFIRHQSTQSSSDAITWSLKEILRDARSLRALFIAGGNPSLDTVLDALLDEEACPRLDQLGYRENRIYRRGPEFVAVPFPEQKFAEILRVRKLKELRLEKFDNIPEEWLRQVTTDVLGLRIVTDALSEMIHGINSL